MKKSEFFNNKLEIYTGSAPGRMDVLGGVADYSGSLLLQMPIKLRTSVSLQKRDDNILNIYSQSAEKSGLNPQVKVDLSSIDLLNNLEEISGIGCSLKLEKNQEWSLYIAGCFFLVMSKRLILSNGADVYVESDVPIGKGVSSSAALEVATLIALSKAYGLAFKDMELPILAQQVENIIVGAPCGLMDQLAVYFGKENNLLPIICQPASIGPVLELPAGLQFIGLDSGVKHSVAGDTYSRARAAAFMGYTIIASHEGVSLEVLKKARDHNERWQLPFNGYLANIDIEQYRRVYESLLHKNIKGSDFLESYKISIDRMTEIELENNYKVQACTAHPIFENHRIKKFKTLLEENFSKDNNLNDILCEMGQILYKSHISYSNCGLGHNATDMLVEMVEKAGPESGVYGARITGGGSGGTVCVMSYGEKGKMTTLKLYKEYLDSTGREGFVIE